MELYSGLLLLEGFEPEPRNVISKEQKEILISWYECGKTVAEAASCLGINSSTAIDIINKYKNNSGKLHQELLNIEEKRHQVTSNIEKNVNDMCLTKDFASSNLNDSRDGEINIHTSSKTPDDINLESQEKVPIKRTIIGVEQKKNLVRLYKNNVSIADAAIAVGMKYGSAKNYIVQCRKNKSLDENTDKQNKPEDIEVTEEILEMVINFYKSGKPIVRAAKCLGISFDTAFDIVTRYKKNGEILPDKFLNSEGKIPSNIEIHMDDINLVKYFSSEEINKMVINLYKSGKTVAEAASCLGIKYNTSSYIINKYKNNENINLESQEKDQVPIKKSKSERIKEKKKVLDLYNSGVLIVNAAKALGMKYNTAKNIIRYYKNKKELPDELLAENTDKQNMAENIEVTEEIGNGVTVAEAASCLRINNNTASDIINRYENNLESQAKDQRRTRKLKSDLIKQKKQLIDLYNSGVLIVDAAKAVGINYSSAKKYIKTYINDTELQKQAEKLLDENINECYMPENINVKEEVLEMTEDMNIKEEILEINCSIMPEDILFESYEEGTTPSETSIDDLQNSLSICEQRDDENSMSETGKSNAYSNALKINNRGIKNIRKNDGKLIENRQPQISIESKKKKIVRNCCVKLRTCPTETSINDLQDSLSICEQRNDETSIHGIRKSTASSSAEKINNRGIKNIRKNDRKLIENRQPQISIESKKKKIVRNCSVKLRTCPTETSINDLQDSLSICEQRNDETSIHETSAEKINNRAIKNIRKNDRKFIENRQPEISIITKKKKIVRNCFVKLRRIKTKLETHETSTSQTFIDGSQCRSTISQRKKKVNINKSTNLLKKPTDESTKLIKLFESGKSIDDAAYEVGININTAKNVIRIFKLRIGLIRKQKIKVRSQKAETREKLIKLVESGKKIKYAASDLGIKYQTAHYIVNQYYKENTEKLIILYESGKSIKYAASEVGIKYKSAKKILKKYKKCKNLNLQEKQEQEKVKDSVNNCTNVLNKQSEGRQTIPAEKSAKLIELYNSGMSIGDAALDVGILYNTANTMLRRYRMNKDLKTKIVEVKLNNSTNVLQKHTGRKPITSEKTAKLIKLYESGKSIGEAASDVGILYNTANNILRKYKRNNKSWSEESSDYAK